MSVGVTEERRIKRVPVGANLGTVGEAAQRLCDAGPEWLRSLRAKAIQRALALGLPTRRFEEWRYTNIGVIAETEYQLAQPVSTTVPSFDQPELDSAARLVFIDGALDPNESSVHLPDVTLTPLPSVEPPGDKYRALLEDNVQHARDGFEALAAGLASAGAMIHIPRGKVLDRPISIVFVHSGQSGAAVLTAPQVIVVADESAEVSVIEDHVGINDARGLTLGTTTLVAGANARIHHAFLVRDTQAWTNYSTLRIRQQRDSRVISHRVITGGDLVRNNVAAVLEGEQADMVLNGLFVPQNHQQHDNHMRVEHRAEHCTSRQYYRGMLADDARGVFTGRIYVAQEAQKTDAVQSNANLLLSPSARVYSKPQLEIYADDVKCTHGATTGQLDGDALFYLRARGLPEKDARLLLLHAFAGESIDRIENEILRTWVRKQIDARLAAMISARS